MGNMHSYPSFITTQEPPVVEALGMYRGVCFEIMGFRVQACGGLGLGWFMVLGFAALRVVKVF